MAGEGHNIADDRLRLLVERAERLIDEKKGIQDDLKDVFSEAKAVGYDAKIVRECIKYRAKKPDDAREFFAILGTYFNALGLDLL